MSIGARSEREGMVVDEFEVQGLEEVVSSICVLWAISTVYISSVYRFMVSALWYQEGVRPCRCLHEADMQVTGSASPQDRAWCSESDTKFVLPQVFVPCDPVAWVRDWTLATEFGGW